MELADKAPHDILSHSFRRISSSANVFQLNALPLCHERQKAVKTVVSLSPQKVLNSWGRLPSLDTLSYAKLLENLFAL